MASSDSLPLPKKNTAYRVLFPIFDADGDLVTGAAGLDSEIAKDCGTFTDCTNEATEIATSSGVYYLDLTSTEMNADSVAVIVKTSTTGAKTTPIFLYPQESGDIPATVEAMNAGTITATAVATGAIDADALATDAVGKIADGVWDEALSGHTTAGTGGKALSDAAAASAPSASVVAAAVWDEALSGHTTAGTSGKKLADLSGIGFAMNTAFPGFVFPMVDDNGDPAPGLTVTVTRSIDGGAFASSGNSATEVSGGAYTIDFTAGDLNGENILFKFEAAGAKTRWLSIITE